MSLVATRTLTTLITGYGLGSTGFTSGLVSGLPSGFTSVLGSFGVSGLLSPLMIFAWFSGSDSSRTTWSSLSLVSFWLLVSGWRSSSSRVQPRLLASDRTSASLSLTANETMLMVGNTPLVWYVVWVSTATTSMLISS